MPAYLRIIAGFVWMNKYKLTSLSYFSLRISKKQLMGGYRNPLGRSREYTLHIMAFQIFAFVTFSAPTPRDCSIVWRWGCRLYKPHPYHNGGARAQRAAPGRAGKIHEWARRVHVQASFSIFNILGPCSFCAHDQILALQARSSKPFPQTHWRNQTHQRIPKEQLLGGYQNAPGRSREKHQKHIGFPGFSLRNLFGFDAPWP